MFHNLIPAMSGSGRLARGTWVCPGLGLLAYVAPECQPLDLLRAPQLWLLRASGQMDSLAPEQGQRLCSPGQPWGRAGLLVKELLIFPLPSEIPPRFPCPVLEVVGSFEPAVRGGGDPDAHNVGREEHGRTIAVPQTLETKKGSPGRCLVLPRDLSPDPPSSRVSLVPSAAPPPVPAPRPGAHRPRHAPPNPSARSGCQSHVAR